MIFSFKRETYAVLGSDPVIEIQLESGEWKDITKEVTELPPEAHKNAHVSTSHACPGCSTILSLLSEMASNPPGMGGIETPKGRLGNAHIDYGWLAAVSMLISHLRHINHSPEDTKSLENPMSNSSI